MKNYCLTDNIEDKDFFTIPLNNMNGEKFETFDNDKDVISNYGDKLKNKSKEDGRYYCFNYALRNYQIFDIEDSVWRLFSNYQRIQNFCQIEKNDILLWYDDYDVLHLSRVIKTDKTIRNTILRAKFGQLGVYEHKLMDNPSYYGHKFLIFRKSKR